MKRLWVTGYRSYELGLFSENDPKYKVLEYALKKLIEQAVDTGTQWVITGGQLGIEQMAARVSLDLKEAYPGLKVAIILPFEQFGNQWQDHHQLKLNQLLSQADFSGTVSKASYQSPQQLKNYSTFLLNHSDGALLVYDPDHEGKARFDYQAIKNWQEQHVYEVQLVDFEGLQEFAYDYQESLNNGFNS